MKSAMFERSAIANLTEMLTMQMSAQSLKHSFKSSPTLRARVYSLWLAQSATVTLRAIVNLTELLTVRRNH